MKAVNIILNSDLKNVRLGEAGAILGIGKISSLPLVWEMFYTEAKKGLSLPLINAFFRWQIASSQVSSRFWFTDGHVLPYSGKEKMHKVFNTKKRETEPGCINFVSCDISGKVVDFQIKEGGAGLREHIINTKTQKRTSALAFPGQTDLSQADCIYAILNRWGASENTFKHSGSRHPTSYRPGFKLLKSKNLFDFAGVLVWNARKKGIEMLKQLYPFENDVVDLFYAIVNCHGTVQISAKEIIVTLEPLQQSSRRIAQVDFCRKLTQLGPKTPMKKNMIIKVGPPK